METKNKRVKIIEVQEKESQAGKTYWVVSTSEGSMSMFDKPIVDKVKALVGQEVDLEFKETDKGFKNIKKVHSDQPTVTEEKFESKPVDSDKFDKVFKEKRLAHDMELAVSIFNASVIGEMKPSLGLRLTLMNECTTIVTQARENLAKMG